MLNPLLPGQDLVDLAQHEQRSTTVTLGSIGGPPLVMKLVKPGKVFSSRTAVEFHFNQLLISQAEPQEGAAQTGVLGKADATARQKLPGLDSPDSFFDQLPELLPL